MAWEKALDAIKSEIYKRGFYHWTDSYQKFKETFKIEAKLRAPQYLSIDFWSQQPKELTNNGLYVIRFGGGSFIIFSEKQFPRPYTILETKNAEEIQAKELAPLPQLKKAFNIINLEKKSAENTLVELMTFYDVYTNLVNHIDGLEKYYIGPRGGMTSSFDVYLTKKNEELKRFHYQGQVELDYTIWTKNRAYIFEAKSKRRGGFDIGWHKLAYPAQRFSGLINKNNFKLSPVYFLRTRDTEANIIYLFVFPPLKFRNGGIVLNDKEAMTPEKVFKIDITKMGII